MVEWKRERTNATRFATELVNPLRALEATMDHRNLGAIGDPQGYAFQSLLLELLEKHAACQRNEPQKYVSV